MAWWGWLLLAFVFFRVLRRRRAYGMGCGMHRQRMRVYSWGWGPAGVVVVAGHEQGSRCGSRGSRDRQREAEPAPPVSLSPKEQRERAIAELRRRYVADDITVEEYERKLDELLREQPN